MLNARTMQLQPIVPLTKPIHRDRLQLLTARQIRTNAIAARHLQDMGVLSTEYLSAAAFFRDSYRVLAHPILCFFSSRIYRVEFCHTACWDPLFLLNRRASVPVGFAEEMRKVRRSHTKSRKGCVQCKNGHVKVGYIA